MRWLKDVQGRENLEKKGEKIEIMGEFEFLQKTRIIMERVI